MAHRDVGSRARRRGWLPAAFCWLSASTGAAAEAARLGEEFQVNAVTDGIQQSASVAMAADGSFVAAWQGEVQGRGDEIRARRFDARGVALGGEIAVNTSTAGPQNVPAVAMAPGGPFVVAWQTIAGDKLAVRARLFDARGVARGDEFAVNAARHHGGGTPAVAMAADGRFVVAWESSVKGRFEVRARRFDPDGAALGGEIAVSAGSASGQRAPSVAIDAAGNFVVAWRSNVDGSFEVRARRFTAAGVAMDCEIAVNAVTAGDQLAPAVAMAAGGDFVVVWENELDNGFEIRARRFTAGGLPREGEVAVHPASAGRQFSPAVAMSVQGAFLVGWHSLVDGSFDVRARAFAPSGAPLSGELAVNRVTAGMQKHAAVAVGADGGFVIAWHGDATADWEIGARRGALGRAPPRDDAQRLELRPAGTP